MDAGKTKGRTAPVDVDDLVHDSITIQQKDLFWRPVQAGYPVKAQESNSAVWKMTFVPNKDNRFFLSSELNDETLYACAMEAETTTLVHLRREQPDLDPKGPCVFKAIPLNQRTYAAGRGLRHVKTGMYVVSSEQNGPIALGPYHADAVKIGFTFI